MELEEPLVNKKFRLEKFPGKSGWTYAAIPQVLQNNHSPFGWVKVKGFIDNFELKNYRLMPMGKGRLFLPVRAEIRKKTGKKAGDWVHVVLYADSSPIEIPDEFLQCLQEDPAAHQTFFSYTEGEKKEFIDWIYSAKRDETKITRIAATLNKLAAGKKRRDNNKQL